MSALPLPLPDAPDRTAPSTRTLPDYLPARMVNEFVYCPRLFFYEWVEGVFRESADTLEGSVQHRRVDSRPSDLPQAAEIEEKIHARSVTLASERLRVIAKLDLVEAEGAVATPVDYKHGAPRDGKDGLEMWPADRVQIALQAIVLRENGYGCEEAVVFYQKTRQRVRIPVNDALVAEAEEAVARAWDLAERGSIPAPLEDSPKCVGCSLNTICLPDETNRLANGSLLNGAQLDLFQGSPDVLPRKPPASEGVQTEVRRLVTPRDDLRPLYLNTQGFRLGKSGEVLQVKDKDKTVQEVRIGEVCQVNLLGNIQISTQAVQSLCEAGIPISYFSMGGYFYGITTGMNTKNVALRRSQFRLADSEWFPLSLARVLVAGKVRNQRTMLQRNHIEPKKSSLDMMKALADRAERSQDLESLLGIEGSAARVYFGEFAGMIKPGQEPDENATGFSFDFEGRNRRPPRDPVNALLSLAYSMLAKDLTVACYAVGFDPYLGFYHQLRHGRPALALDLMEPFRPLIADSAVLSALNTRMVTEKDFVRAGASVALTPAGRKGFFRAYELRMDTLVTHPLFDYRVSYRRLLEIQARLLARVIEGEIPAYPVFVTR
ncbi:MAG TPA: CRISPR-associated endonuclease Cas1 [Bryobacteraceae bacterium]|nr:CRISPR-associated endonuclease Cas1 [Bryobacteraceae bacterium]